MISRNPMNAAGARQILTLTGNGQSRAWNTQAQALKTMVDFIMLQVGGVALVQSKKRKFELVQNDTRELELKRRVFMKVGDAIECDFVI
jgi:hypothetical protein